MDWDTQRTTTRLIVILVPLLILSGVALLYFYEPPSCFDGKWNQDEEGIDCGGSCAAVCQENTLDLSVAWSRAFSITPSVYNAVAYIENPNFSLTAEDIPYKFTFFDNQNTVIGEREGVATIPPQTTFAVFEHGIQVDNRRLARTTFEFTQEPFWKHGDEERPEPEITEKTLSDLSRSPRLDIVVENNSLKLFEDVRLITVLYGRSGNAVNASRTVIPEIASDTREDAVFTWQQPFGEDIVEIEVIPVSYTIVE